MFFRGLHSEGARTVLGRPENARLVRATVLGYLVALIATVATLMAYPFSKPLTLTFFGLIGLFFATAGVVIARAFNIALSRIGSAGLLLNLKCRIHAAR
jgi:hypothetical protein